MYNPTMTTSYPYGYGNYSMGGSAFPQHNPRQVLMVGGYNGASMIQMGPNESVLALDESGTMVWLVKTDGAGYKNIIQSYDIIPHEEKVQDLSSYEERIQKLEDYISKIQVQLGEINNGNTTNSTSVATNTKSVTILGQN